MLDSHVCVRTVSSWIANVYVSQSILCVWGGRVICFDLFSNILALTSDSGTKLEINQLICVKVILISLFPLPRALHPPLVVNGTEPFQREKNKAQLVLIHDFRLAQWIVNVFQSLIGVLLWRLNLWDVALCEKWPLYNHSEDLDLGDSYFAFSH